ncbi:hypothetical protein GCM10022209_28750 [Chitinophaga oryziterrae]
MYGLKNGQVIIGQQGPSPLLGDSCYFEGVAYYLFKDTGNFIFRGDMDI